MRTPTRIMTRRTRPCTLWPPTLTPPVSSKVVPAPYSELPTDWRSPLQGGNAVPEAESEREEGVEEEQQRAAPPSREDASVRTPAQVLQDATRVTPSAAMSVARLGVRTMPSPPGIDSSLQTENQRRRALPLSKLKRVKPKRK